MRAHWIALALALSSLPRPARACATAPPPGVEVQIAEESAIIVWDDQAKREHFVRRASFRSTGREFGFLVPTPGKPELGEVPDGVFDALERVTRPEVVVEHPWKIVPTLSCAFFMLRTKSDAAGVAAAVRVLDAQRVAGYDAVVLEADSAGALAAWLKDHGYDERPELRAWLAPYVAARWKVTAFKIAGDAGASSVETAAVRMTFPAERPFYPYREPSDQRENVAASVRVSERLLRVFFLGPGRFDGTIGETRAPWPGKAVWSDGFDPKKLPETLPFSVPDGAWLTMFEDKATPRPGTDDLFFAPAKGQGPVKPPPVIQVVPDEIPVPLDLVAIASLVVWYLVRLVRRKPA